MKLTRVLVKYYMKDEKKASNAYAKLKLKRLSNDEKRYFKFFKGLLKKNKTI